MHRPIRSPHSRSAGSVLLTAVVMLAIAGITVASILTAVMTYNRNAEATHCRETAAFLADAGLRAALVKLNAFSEGNISYNQSRGYFSRTDNFTAPDWGFMTQVVFTNQRNVLVSTGRYQSKTVKVQAAVSLGNGSRSIHALYAHALFAGNSSGDTNYVLKVGGTGTGSDFVRGDAYSGNDITLTGTSMLRLPEQIVHDYDADGICDPSTDTWHNAYATQVFTNPLSQTAFNTYSNSMATKMSKVYNNGKYDFGEAFVDTIGNGVYDVGEPYVDVNNNHVRDNGDTFIDRNGNGVYNAGVDTVVDYGNGQYDAGEEWTEDTNPLRHGKRINGRYDPAGGYYNSSGQWITANYKVNKVTYRPSTWPAEQYEDAGDGVYNPSGETYTDRNGIYDDGEKYLDDRNSLYDYGTQAPGTITGMPAPGDGQRAATGGDAPISAPDLVRMYYEVNRNDTEPNDALSRWGNDVAVTASDFGTYKCITDKNQPEHIFVRNPPTSGSVSSRGKTISGRSYTALKNTNNQWIDDYFLEDAADSSYNSSPAPAICKDDNVQREDGTWYNNVTDSMYVDVTAQHNVKLYYVNGNLYIHHPSAFSMRFRQPGTRITIVARGNITISDEFYYNAEYPTGTAQIDYANFNSSKVPNPQDALCLIALKNPLCANSGNIYIGDKQFGTGGSIHALLYAENNFVDNNLDTGSQNYISVFGNMTAGNQVNLIRTGSNRTRLDVTLDERIREGTIIVPGLPHPVGNERSIQLDSAWRMVTGTWSSWSMLK